MKKLLLLSLMVLMAVTAMARPVDPDRAVAVAKHFMAQYVKGADQYTAEVIYTHRMPKSGHAAMYVVNLGFSPKLGEGDPQGGGVCFVIVAADDVAHPVLGYSLSRPWPSSSPKLGEGDRPNGVVEESVLPPQVSGYLDDLAAQIESAAGSDSDTETVAEWRQLLTTNLSSLTTNLPDSVGPLLTTTWDQGQYYNALCPEDANGPDGHVYTGCVATAMAQIINYWGYPVHGRGTHSYETNYGTLTVNYDSANYDYANMPTALTAASTPAQVNAVATLMRDCGVAANMGYGATGSNAFDQDARAGLINFFHFSPDLSYAEKNNFTHSVWNNLLRENIAAGHPLLYGGTGSSGGHAFVCDGYKDGYFHFNFGWNGYADGWYLTSSINPGRYDFSSTQDALLGIVPDSTGNVIIGQMAGTSNFTVDEPLEFYHLMGHNAYTGTPYDNSCSNSVIFTSADTTRQIVINRSIFEQQSINIYDDTAGNPIASLVEGFDNYRSTVVSTNHTMKVEYLGYFSYSGFRLDIMQDRDCRIVTNIVDSIDMTSVNLTWTENGDASQWQIEYGERGFLLGDGTTYTSSVNNVTFNDLESSHEYDFYIRPICGDNQFGLWNMTTLELHNAHRVNGLYYKIIEGGVEVTYQPQKINISAYTNYPDTIVIPQQVTINGTSYPVVAIGDKAFQYCWNLKAVIIPNSIKTIGEDAFNSDYQITYVDLPDSLIEIKRNAFLGVQINNISLPNTLARIGIQAFSFTPLSSITIPPSVKTIGSGLCFTFDARRYILIGDGNVSLPRSATGFLDTLCFEFSTTLDTINWNADSCDAGIESDSSGSLPPFWGHASVVNIGNNVHVIPVDCFWTACKDSVVTIPENVTYIGINAFSLCRNIKKVNFNAKRCRLAFSPFEHCDSLETVIIGDSVKIIPSTLFKDSPLNGRNTESDYVDWPCHVSTVIIGNAVDSIAGEAFMNCTDLQNIVIPSSVKYIGQWAFANCTGLKQVYMNPETPPLLDRGAFQNNAEDRVFIIQCQNYESYYNATGWDSSYFGYYRQIYWPLDEYRISLKGIPESHHQLVLVSNDTAMGKVRVYKSASACDSSAIYFAEAKEGYHLDHWSNGRTSNPDTLLVTEDTTITAYFAKNQYHIAGIPASTIIYTDFENPEQDTLWRLKNEDYVNRWFITDLDSVNWNYFDEDDFSIFEEDHFLVDNRGRALFVSNDNGLSNEFSNSSVDDFSYVFAYFPINLGVGTYYGSFDWRCFEVLDTRNPNEMARKMMQQDVFTTFFYKGDVDEIPLADTNSRWSTCITSDCCMGYDYNNYLSKSLYTQIYNRKNWEPTDQYFQREYFNSTISSNDKYNLLFYWRNGRLWNWQPLYANGLPPAIDNILFGKQDTTCGHIVGANVTVDVFDTVELTAVPNYGYHFTCWYDLDTNSTKRIVAKADSTYIAYFEKNRYNITAISADTIVGSVTGGGNYEYLSQCTLTANPKEGFRFLHWSDGNTDNPRIITISKDSSFMAYFEICTMLYMTDSITTCDSYTWHGINYTADNILMDTLTHPDGCDSIVTHHLIVNHGSSRTDTVSAMESYVWADSTYTFSGIYQRIYPASNNCDSVVNLWLTISKTQLDTTYVEVHDTTYVDVPYAVYDTTYVNVHDTTYVPYHIHDTTYVDVHDTTYVDVHDTTFVPYPVYDTLYMTDTLRMTDTIFVHDTIVIYDTITVGVDAVEYINAKIYANQGQIVVEGADGNTVTLYDVSGRQLATKRDDYMPLRLDVPAAGTYMVKIGDYPARRVVVIK